MATTTEPSDDEGRFRFLLLSHKDTDILTLSSAKLMLPHHFPRIESKDLCSLSGDEDMEAGRRRRYGAKMAESGMM